MNISDVMALVNASKLVEAKQLCVKLCQKKPSDADLVMALGAINGHLGLFNETETCMLRVIELRPNYAEAHYNLGIALLEQRKPLRAIQALKKAIELKPDYTEAKENLNKLYSSGIIHKWHFPMMNDEGRNSVYNEALKKAVRPGDQVLDIGSGSGLLAMMAARAGAAAVTTCEVIPIIAEKAREITALNGFSNTITVIGKRSTNLQVGVDLPVKADVLVSEILDVGVLGEGVVGAVEHARKHLLKPGAAIIPEVATVYAQLVESTTLHQSNYVSTASGFDVSPFNDFSSRFYVQMDVRHYPYKALSEPFEVFGFDFRGEPIRSEERRLSVNATDTGRCHAIVFWFRLKVYDDIYFETSPQSETCWMQAVQIFEQPFDVQKSSVIDLRARHDCDKILFSPLT